MRQNLRGDTVGACNESPCPLRGYRASVDSILAARWKFIGESPRATIADRQPQSRLQELTAPSARYGCACRRRGHAPPAVRDQTNGTQPALAAFAFSLTESIWAFAVSLHAF